MQAGGVVSTLRWRVEGPVDSLDHCRNVPRILKRLRKGWMGAAKRGVRRAPFYRFNGHHNARAMALGNTSLLLMLAGRKADRRKGKKARSGGGTCFPQQVSRYMSRGQKLPRLRDMYREGRLPVLVGGTTGSQGPTGESEMQRQSLRLHINSHIETVPSPLSAV